MVGGDPRAARDVRRRARDRAAGSRRGRAAGIFFRFRPRDISWCRCCRREEVFAEGCREDMRETALDARPEHHLSQPRLVRRDAAGRAREAERVSRADGARAGALLRARAGAAARRRARELAEFLGADPQGLAFVPNATAGVNAVLRSLDLDKHDELLVTKQEYNACRNTLDYVATRERREGRGRRHAVPHRVAGRSGRAGAGEGHRSHAAAADRSHHQPDGADLPVERIVKELRARDRHADRRRARARDCSRWTSARSAPRTTPAICTSGSARRRARRFCTCARTAAPACVRRSSATARTRRARDRSRFLLEFDWTGTFDPTPWLCVPDSLRFIGVARRRRMAGDHAPQSRARAARARLLCEALGIDKPAPDEMLGAMAAIPLARRIAGRAAGSAALRARHRGADHAVAPPPNRCCGCPRSCTTRRDYERLADALDCGDETRLTRRATASDGDSPPTAEPR